MRPSGWSGIKELLVYDYIDAAHMLSPMPLACSLGIDGKKAEIKLATVQNVNGQALTLATEHIGIKNVLDMKGFTFGVPYRFSMHYYLLCYFLASNGLNPLKDVSIIEVAPPTMPFYLKKGRVDGIFAPEPFNQIPVYQKIGFIYILSKDIWPGHPCCSFATTQKFIDIYPNTYRIMLKSVIEAELMLHEADIEQRKTIAKEISAPPYLNQNDYIPVAQALSGDFPDGKGGNFIIPNRIDFIPHPWAEYGIWILSQMQRWSQLPGKVDYKDIIESVFELEETKEFAKALGFKTKNKPSLRGVHPFTGKDPLNYMLKQPYSAFKEESKPPKKIHVSELTQRHLSKTINQMADVAGGNLDKKMEISVDGEIGQLQLLFNELVLNMKFMRDNLTEKN
ncbi:MAG: ABC transporter substrate-binding protein, partial [Candidatus Heimdallarchaeota archaeon]|nr:ABC transporter substrate-binding protein [Candidatus Heimdallarchaeota archaeon]